MMSSVQNAKRNDLKSTLKFVVVALTLIGILFGTALGVALAASLKTELGLLQSPAFFSLILGGLFLIAIAWHYAKKIDRL
ncbi:hypothetical protein [Rheinheimera sp.]|jgi:uncharacterized membrane protein|uniref:hypothetical protein n=1 Tax=Rheinheimera sp. TaxID=1869214 RepID=UPI00261452C1|nr:hypothetical protein [Rheinheimera sp.]MCA1929933.1 hypothetical protein [Rheinheimera sp.]